MTRDEGIHLPVGKRLPSQESLLNTMLMPWQWAPEQIAGGVTVASA
jgi:hypothetical protein